MADTENPRTTTGAPRPLQAPSDGAETRRQPSGVSQDPETPTRDSTGRTEPRDALDRARRYLVPVARIQLPGEPDVIHLSLYEWLPQFEHWATSWALCGYSAEQGALPEGTEITCAECLKYEPGYREALDRQAGITAQQPAGDARFARVFNAISDALREADAWIPLSARRAATTAALAAIDTPKD